MPADTHQSLVAAGSLRRGTRPGDQRLRLTVDQVARRTGLTVCEVEAIAARLRAADEAQERAC